VLFGVCDKRLHYSFGSLDLDELFLHLDAFRVFASAAAKTHAKVYICKGPAPHKRDAKHRPKASELLLLTILLSFGESGRDDRSFFS
jgi:hypothetical protein